MCLSWIHLHPLPGVYMTRAAPQRSGLRTTMQFLIWHGARYDALQDSRKHPLSNLSSHVTCSQWYTIYSIVAEMLRKSCDVLHVLTWVSNAR